jgi:serine/threonine-protein kinase
MLSADDDTDHVKVLDFGLVKSFVAGQELEGRAITQQGMLMGSPPYMAPEQADRGRADPRSDIYSLGCILFQALTGRPPFSGTSPIEIILKHVNDPLPAIVTPAKFEAIPEGMSGIVIKCLQKSPMDRFQSMDEVLQAMSELTSPVATPAFETPLPSTPLPDPTAKRNNTALLIAGFVVALLVGIGGTALVLRKPKTVEPATKHVLFHIETEPAGALVVIGNIVKGTTPLDVSLTAVDGRAKADVTLKKDGYLPMTVTAAGSGPRIELVQKLQLRPVEKPVEPKVEKPPEKLAAPPKLDPIERAFQEPTANPKNEALPSVTPVKGSGQKNTGKKPPGPKPASRLEDDDDPLAPKTPPPANDLKRPK